MNKTEEMEANLKKFRTHGFEVAHRILICLENIKDFKKCLNCQDSPMCMKFRDLVGKC